MLIDGYIVMVGGKENKYYSKVDVRKLNSTKKIRKKLQIESYALVKAFTIIMSRKFLNIYNSKTFSRNQKI
jgi:hypothetical protein